MSALIPGHRHHECVGGEVFPAQERKGSPWGQVALPDAGQKWGWFPGDGCGSRIFSDMAHESWS